MKNVFLSIGIVISLSPVSLNAGHSQTIHEEIDGLYYQEQSSLRSVIQKYVASIVPGIIVGANTGIFCSVFDHLMPPLWPLFWVGSYFHRTNLVNNISENYTKRHIPHDKVLMDCCALIASWITHYKMYEVVHGNPPF